MTRAWIVTVLLVLLSAVDARTEDVEHLKPGVVKITSVVDGMRAEGTGFIVSLNDQHADIITASHVIRSDPRPSVYFFAEQEKPYEANVIGTEGGEDEKGLAVIRVEGSLPAGLMRIGLDTSFPLKAGDTVMSIGFPRLASTPWTVTEIAIAGRQGRMLTVSGAIDVGSSGSPMLRNGWATGIVTQKAGEFGFAVPADAVLFALEGWGVKVGNQDRPIASEPPPSRRTGDLAKTKIAFQTHGSAYVMDADGRNPVALLEGDGEDATWSPDGTSVAYVRSDDIWSLGIYLMDLRTHRERRLSDPDAMAYYSRPTFSPDGTRIAFLVNTAIAEDSRDVFVMKADGSDARPLTHRSSRKVSVFWSPGGTKLGFAQIGADGGETFLMDADGKNAQRLSSPLTDFYGYDWSPDGRRIVGVSTRDGSDAIYSMNVDGSDPKRLANDAAGEGSPFWAPDGSRIVFASNRDGHAEIYVMKADGTEQTRLTKNVPTSGSDCTSPRWSPFSVTMRGFDTAAEAAEGTCPQRGGGAALGSGRPEFVIQGKPVDAVTVAYSPDGKTLTAITASGTRPKGSTVFVWDAASGRLIKSIKASLSNGGVIVSPDYFAYRSDGKAIGIGQRPGPFGVLDLETGQMAFAIDVAYGFNACAFSPDGGTVALGDNNHNLVLRDAKAGDQPRKLSGHQGPVTAVAYSADGKLIATASGYDSRADDTVKLWNAATGEVVRSFEADGGPVAVAFSPDGGTLASGGDRIELWDLKNDKKSTPLRTIEHKSELRIRSIAFSPDGRKILTGEHKSSGEGGEPKPVANVWDVRGTLVRSLEANYSEGQAAAFSPSGKTLALAHDHAIEIRSTESGKLLLSLVAFTDGNWLTFTPDGYFSGSSEVGKDAVARVGRDTHELAHLVDVFCKPDKVAEVLGR